MLITMSWRNVWRNKLRSLVVIMAIAVGLVGGVFISGMMNGLVLQQTDNAINNEISDIQIHDPGFLENMNPGYLIKNANDKIALIKKQPMVTAVSYRTKTVAMAGTATTGAGVTINGIIPETEKTVTTIHSNLVEGTYFEKKMRTSPIVIGQKLSHKLKADVGKKIVITVQALNGEMAYALFRVEGIFKTNDSRFDETNVFVKYSDLNSVLGIRTGEANEIAVKTATTKDAATVAENLKKEFKGLTVQTWSEIKPSLIIMTTMMNQFSYWLMIIIMIALIFGIINTMLMVILERKHELGMLMAIGMNKKRVYKMILIETTLLSLSGGLSGLLVSMILIKILGHTGINFAFWSKGLEAMGYSSFVFPVVSTQFYIVITILVIFTAIIASIWPTRKALKLNPAEAIREE